MLTVNYGPRLLHHQFRATSQTRVGESERKKKLRVSGLINELPKSCGGDLWMEF